MRVRYSASSGSTLGEGPQRLPGDRYTRCAFYTRTPLIELTESRVVHYEACRFKPAAANNVADALSDVGSQLQRLSINGK